MYALTPEFSTLCALLDISERIVLPHLSHAIPFSLKKDRTPVTTLDQDIEEEMRHTIAKLHPSHTIYGEEYGFERDRQDRSCWVLDPIDGTKSLLTGSPLFGSMCAYTYHGKAILSGIAFPALKTKFLTDAKRAYKQDKIITVSTCKDIQNAKLASTAHVHFTVQELATFHKVAEHTAFTRYGGDCYNYACLACGLIDVIVEAGLATYDYIPLIPLVEKAGGVITDWQGNALDQTSPLGTQKKQLVAAATPALHEQVLKLLS